VHIDPFTLTIETEAKKIR